MIAWERLATAPFVLLLLVAPARADWEYTKWGMTADEIVAASGGAASKLLGAEAEKYRDPDHASLAIGSFVTGPFEFKVRFDARSNDDKLHAVHLELKDISKYEGLRDALSAKYGQGEAEKDGSGYTEIHTTTWRTNSEVIKLSRLDSVVDGPGVVMDYIGSTQGPDHYDPSR